jgi:hypothetical protein
MKRICAGGRAVAVASLVALLGSGAALAQSQAMDPTFAEHVKEWTTRPEFLSPLVDHLPATSSATTSVRRASSTITRTC